MRPVIVAHIAGVPVEELLSFAPLAGVLWLAVRARAGAGRRSGDSV